MEVINIGNRVVNNYVIKTDQGYIVIDTGYPGNYPRFKRMLDKWNIPLSGIRYIFVTHVHDDHIGFLQELVDATDAALIMHKDSPGRLLVGHNRYEGGCSSRFARMFVQCMVLAGKGKHTFPKMEVDDDVLLWDGTQQFFREAGIPIDIVFLPGHTGDHIGLITDNGILFCGDATMNGFPSTNRNIIWIEDLENYVQSWDKMIACDARMIYPSHGKPFPKSDLIRYRERLNRLRLWKINYPSGSPA